MSGDRPERGELGESAIEIPADIPREVLAEAIAQLEREDPVYQADFQELYGAALEAMAAGDLRPVEIPETFGPED